MNIQRINSTNNNQKVNFTSRSVSIKTRDKIFALCGSVYKSTAEHPSSMLQNMESLCMLRPYMLLPEQAEKLTAKIHKGKVKSSVTKDILLNKKEQEELHKIQQEVHSNIRAQHKVWPSENKKTDRTIIEESGIYKWFESRIEKATPITLNAFDKAIKKMKTITAKYEKDIAKVKEDLV